MQKLSFILIVILLSSCEDVKYSRLCHTENKNGISEVYLVDNLPSDSVDILKSLRSFNIDIESIDSPIQRTFILQHSNSIIDVVMGDEIDYKESKCEDLDNMDFIYKVSKVYFHAGGDTIIYRKY
jgi:hypothetical protein